jgi:hypothetical protein
MNATKWCLPALIALLIGCGPTVPAENTDRLEPQTEAVHSPVVDPAPAPDKKPALSSAAGADQSTDNPAPLDGDSSSSAKPEQPRPSLDELLLFFPSKYPHGNWKPEGLAFEDVWFDSDDGTRIHGWYCPCERPRAVLLYAHGNAGNVSHRAPLLARLQQQLRVSVLIFDYRGYGRSEGIATVEGILRDARAARALLAEHAGVHESEIVLMGRSLGGAVAVQLAAEARPRGLILESTFSTLRDVAAVHYPKLAWLVPADKLDSAAQITRFQGPLLQSHGDADRTIPYDLGQKLFRAAGEPKQFVTIPHGDHNHPQSAEYYEQLDRFLDSL